MTNPNLAQMMAGSGPLLLDFDGPVCSIFAEYPAHVIASELRGLLLESVTGLPASVEAERDPLEILRWTGTVQEPVLTHIVEDALTAAELRAVAGASPTSHARDVLSAAQQRRRQVAIVSNNSAQAIESYLDIHCLSSYVTHVVGREPYHPEKMKPHPHSILTALAKLDSEPHNAVLIGDSLTDIAASRRAGVRVIGYANKADKSPAFELAGADAVVLTMADVAEALASS